MRAIMDYTSKESYVKSIIKNINTKCIIFANTQKQADRICKHSYHSKNPKSEENLELFSDGRINHLSCVLQLSEGVTIPNLKQGIIMHAYGNEKKTAQRIGRLLRLNPSETAVCHILCYTGTQDETWVTNALKDFDLSPNFIKNIILALSEHDDTADYVLKNGKEQPDSNLRDSEKIPFLSACGSPAQAEKQDIEEYFEREVKPYYSRAWLDRKKDKVGYELNFTKYFYEYKPPRPLEEIEKDIKEVTSEIQELLQEEL